MTSGRTYVLTPYTHTKTGAVYYRCEKINPVECTNGDVHERKPKSLYVKDITDFSRIQFFVREKLEFEGKFKKIIDPDELKKHHKIKLTIEIEEGE